MKNIQHCKCKLWNECYQYYCFVAGEFARIEGVEDKVYGDILQGEHEGSLRSGQSYISGQILEIVANFFVVHNKVNLVYCTVHVVNCTEHTLTLS